jgi:hypothetical protein
MEKLNVNVRGNLDLLHGHGDRLGWHGGVFMRATT